jgi:hypothetical protein
MMILSHAFANALIKSGKRTVGPTATRSSTGFQAERDLSRDSGQAPDISSSDEEGLAAKREYNRGVQEFGDKGLSGEASASCTYRVISNRSLKIWMQR